MKQFISKSALVEEIEKKIRMYSTVDVEDNDEVKAIYGPICHVLWKILSFIDTLETKKLDS